jgi:tetratricopeptide (TPR) repeat protein
VTVDDDSPLKRHIAITLALVAVLGGGIAIAQRDAGTKESTTARETTRAAVRALRANVVVTATSGTEARRLAQRRRLDAARETLSQRALATTRVTWNTRSTQYTTVIAVLAAALFFVGYALVVEGPLRPYSYGLGVATAVFAAGWALWIFHLPIPETSPRAVAAAARATVLGADGRPRAAVAGFSRALAIDDDYAAAYLGRSRARLQAANPDYSTSGAWTDRGGRASRLAIRDAERAQALDPGKDLLGPGLVALHAFFAGDLDKALAATDDALAINPHVPDVWLLRGAALLARGDRAAGDAALDRGLALATAGGASERARHLAATALSELAWVARHHPARAADARRAADRVVAAETASTLRRRLSGRAPARARVRVTGLRWSAGRLHLRLAWDHLPPGTAVSAVAYERPLPGGAWTQPAALALFFEGRGRGARRIAAPAARVCRPTAVRVDVFLDGERVLTQTGPGAAPTC